MSYVTEPRPARTRDTAVQAWLSLAADPMTVGITLDVEL